MEEEVRNSGRSILTSGVSASRKLPNSAVTNMSTPLVQTSMVVARAREAPGGASELIITYGKPQIVQSIVTREGTACEVSGFEGAR